MNGSFFKIAASLLVSCAFPLIGSYLAYWRFQPWFLDHTWVTEPSHGVLEAFGACASLIVAAFLLLLSRNRRAKSHYIWLSCGMLFTGILDLFHGSLPLSATSSWLRTSAILGSGFLFVLVWLPDWFAESRFSSYFPGVVAVIAFLVAFLSLIFPSYVPLMVKGNEFTFISKTANSLGGVFYLLTALNLGFRYRLTGTIGDLVMLNILLLLSSSLLMFPISIQYGLIWWLAHTIKVLAYVIALFYVFFVYQRAERLLQESRDELERRVNERTSKLKDSEDRFRLLVEESPLGIVIAQNGKIVYANPAFLEIFGYDGPDEALGRSTADHVAPEDRELITKRRTDRLEGKSVPMNYEVRGLRKDGRVFDLALWPRVINYLGEPAILTFCADRSETKSMRTQLFQAQKMEAIGTLAGGIAHDFNNLLQIVLGYSEFMLQRKKEGEKDYADLQRIIQAGERGTNLAKGLLTFGRKVETRYVPLNLNQEIKQVQDLLSHTIPKTINIDLHLNSDMELIQADPSQINQILMNLGINARDAMPDGGTLIFETQNIELDEDYCRTHFATTPGRYVLLAVSDTGQGMDKETLSHIFEPFFTTKKEGKGTGLGLATVYGIVRQHEGHIICYSEPGHGTTFKIYLPAIQMEKHSETKTGEVVAKGGTETILVVDDDDVITDLVSKSLISSGYEVIVSGNGKEALEIYQREGEQISLVILDLIMPEMDGRQCLEEILRIDPKVKVLIASGYSLNGQAKGILALGVKGFVEKPFNMRKLLHKVREILDKD